MLNNTILSSRFAILKKKKNLRIMKLCYRLFAIALAFGTLSTFQFYQVEAEQPKTHPDGTCVETTLNDKSGTCTPLGMPPMVEGSSYLSSEFANAKNKDIFGCCTKSSSSTEDELTPSKIGEMPQFTTEQSLKVLESAKKAWNHGNGVWPQMSMAERIEAIEKFLDALHEQRTTIINLLMWEIGKNHPDATAEFDRTIAFCKQVIEVIRTDADFAGVWKTVGSTKAFVRRAAIGIILALGPYNYPLNETYATIIPALLMGNIVLLKIPTVGGLVHFLTSTYPMWAFEKPQVNSFATPTF